MTYGGVTRSVLFAGASAAAALPMALLRLHILVEEGKSGLADCTRSPYQVRRLLLHKGIHLEDLLARHIDDHRRITDAATLSVPSLKGYSPQQQVAVAGYGVKRIYADLWRAQSSAGLMSDVSEN